MTKITLIDGKQNLALDMETGDVAIVTLKQHAMRFHIIDAYDKKATKQFITGDDEEIGKIVNALKANNRVIFRASPWITVSWKTRELRDASKWRALAQKEFDEYGSFKDVEITGCSMRYIRYTSDGHITKTPDAIGMYGGSPLIYQGWTVAVIFKINGTDVLASDNNVVYTLPKKWWESFHNNYRDVPKEFPSRAMLGFVCTNWCQRHGHDGYHNGIWLASMTQNHSLHGWAETQLRQWWRGRGGIPGDEAIAMPKSSGTQTLQVSMNMAKMLVAGSMALNSGAALGVIGSVCVACGGGLVSPFSKCPSCGHANSPSYLVDYIGNVCRKCGKMEDKCQCGEGDSDLMKMNPSISYSDHSYLLKKKLKEVETGWS